MSYSMPFHLRRVEMVRDQTSDRTSNWTGRIVVAPIHTLVRYVSVDGIGTTEPGVDLLISLLIGRWSSLFFLLLLLLDQAQGGLQHGIRDYRVDIQDRTQLGVQLGSM